MKDLGKTGRALTFSSYLSSSIKQGDKTQHTRTVAGLSDESVDLLYKIKNNSFYAGNDISYVEPISELIKIKASVNADFSLSDQDKDAFNADGTKNTYYTHLFAEQKGILRKPAAPIRKRFFPCTRRSHAIPYGKCHTYSDNRTEL